LQVNQENESQGEPYIKHGQQQNGGGLPQSSYAAPSEGAVQIGGGKKRIICDRNVTTGANGGRLRRQVACEEVKIT
jgi:hypothetical protein